jgi:hypothetical protein
VLKFVLSFFGCCRKKGTTVLLLGRSGAGATSLFYQLKLARFVDTQTSMKANDAVFVPKALAEGTKTIARCRYLDLPGLSQSPAVVAEHLPEARAIVYVIDEAKRSDMMPVANALFFILSDANVSRRRVPVHI